MHLEDAWWEALLERLHTLIDRDEKADVVILLGRKNEDGYLIPPKIHIRLLEAGFRGR